MKYYIICSNKRSGTHLLTSLLSQVGVGNPVEISYRFTMKKKRKKHPIKELEGIYKNFVKGDICGITMFSFQYDIAIQKFQEITGLRSVEGFKILKSLFPDVQFIYLYRLNKIKQAISLVKTMRTGVFSGNDLAGDVGEYSEREIKDCLARIAKWESYWINFFEKYDIHPYFLTYEELCRDKARSVSGIMDYLGLGFKSNLTLEKYIDTLELPIPQYDATNEEWYRKFINRK